MWALAAEVGLDLNSPYAYVMWGDHFAGTSIVAEDGATARATTPPGGDAGGLEGFVTGFRPPRDGTTLFVWQVGVAPASRGRGVAAAMLDELVARTGVRFVEATVTPGNEASASLFRGVGRRHGAPVHTETAYPEDLFPGGHEAEVRFRIGPLGRTRTDRRSVDTTTTTR